MRREKNFILIQEDDQGNFQLKSKWDADDTIDILNTVIDMIQEVQLEMAKEEREAEKMKDRLKMDLDM